MNTIQERLKAIIEVETNDRGRFSEMERLTEISANSWKSFWHGRQRPTCEMIEATCIHWPQYAFWLGTGITDAKYGHINHRGEASFPEKRRARRTKAKDYLEHAASTFNWHRHVAQHPEIQRTEEDYVAEHNGKIMLLELEIGRDAELQALNAIENTDLIQELIKMKTPEFLRDEWEWE